MCHCCFGTFSQREFCFKFSFPYYCTGTFFLNFIYMHPQTFFWESHKHSPYSTPKKEESSLSISLITDDKTVQMTRHSVICPKTQHKHTTELKTKPLFAWLALQVHRYMSLRLHCNQWCDCSRIRSTEIHFSLAKRSRNTSMNFSKGNGNQL